jgi:hypothetical protein
MRKEETSTRITAILYERIAVRQDVVDPDADALVGATVVHLLRSRQLTSVGKTRTFPCQSRHEMQAWQVSIDALFVGALNMPAKAFCFTGYTD